ncbi:hypothetical protein OEB99_00210 [Actinotalea sp. M2MS4P-6]|uniref:hypothetical protein n=1 Tax=Actinotalea sp. M2MS4P-6 TaxID=2983762 RepID=UPI0021E46175|nr:hypothetical protein [Actinotalea sp. M2MS4P-6]MCV2392720.1 hypothetical protein [Actinotalea sp. M2MS4P-6]
MTRTVSTTSAVLHGTHPLRGYPVTYRLTPLVRQPGMPAGFMVEEADGDLSEDAWETAEISRVLMTPVQVRELVARVTHRVPTQR